MFYCLSDISDRKFTNRSVWRIRNGWANNQVLTYTRDYHISRNECTLESILTYFYCHAIQTDSNGKLKLQSVTTVFFFNHLFHYKALKHTVVALLITILYALVNLICCWHCHWFYVLTLLNTFGSTSFEKFLICQNRLKKVPLYLAQPRISPTKVY